MLVSMVGNEFNYVPGDIVEVREDVAESWETHGIAATYVPPEEKVVTHVEEIVEEETTEETKEDVKEETVEEPKPKEEKPKGKGKGKTKEDK